MNNNTFMNNQNSSNQINSQSNFNGMNINMIRNDFPNQKPSFNNEILNPNLLESSTILNFNNIKNNQNMNNQNMNNQSLSQNNSLSLEKQNKEYKIKINNLEKYIKELEVKLKEKEKIINEEKIKNEKLNKEINNLKNISNINSKIKELENEIQLFKLFFKFSDGEKLILIKFVSVNQDINFEIITKNTEIFSKLEPILYKSYPKYIESENYFLVHGNKINRNKSLKENKINNNDVITLEVNNLD